MSLVRLHDGFDDPEPIAFGLPAPELLVVVACAITGLLLLRSPWPRVVVVPPAMLLTACGALLGWGRWQEHTFLEWATHAVRFLVRRRSANVLLATDNEPPARTSDAESPEPATPAPAAPVPVSGSASPNSDWRQWLEPEDDPQEPAVEAPAAEVPPIAHVDIDEQPELPFAIPGTEPPVRSVLTVMDSAAEAVALPEELPEGELEIDGDDEYGVIIPFTRAPREPETESHQATDPAAVAIADEIVPDNAPRATAFVGAPRRITFFSLNGGTGKTTLCTEVAGLLASRGEHTPNGIDRQKLRVAIVDLDLRSASVSVRLGIPQPTIWDYATATGDTPPAVEDYLVKHASGVHALLGPPKPVPASNHAINPETISDVVADLEAASYHYIFFDIASDLNPTTTWVLNAVHDIFVVMTGNASGIQDAYRTAAVLRRMGLRHKLSYVVNRVRSNLDVSGTMADLSGKLVAQIPYDHRVEDDENAHKLTVEQIGPAAEAIQRLAAVIYPGLAAAPRKTRFQLPWRRRAAH